MACQVSVASGQCFAHCGAGEVQGAACGPLPFTEARDCARPQFVCPRYFSLEHEDFARPSQKPCKEPVKVNLQGIIVGSTLYSLRCPSSAQRLPSSGGSMRAAELLFEVGEIKIRCFDGVTQAGGEREGSCQSGEWSCRAHSGHG